MKVSSPLKGVSHELQWFIIGIICMSSGVYIITKFGFPETFSIIVWWSVLGIILFSFGILISFIMLVIWIVRVFLEIRLKYT